MIRFFAFLRSHYDSITALLLNVLGGVLAALAWELSKWAIRRLSKLRFKEVFGRGSAVHLVYASFSINSGPFPLTKASDPSLAFSATRVASGCEIRAAAYLAHAVSGDGRAVGLFEGDDQLEPRLDIDLIAFGTFSNRKATDSFVNKSNDLCEFDLRSKAFVWKGTTTRLYQEESGKDYGIILKIHPEQFPARTWIVCAGQGEWGTSGAAWFLARKWKQIRKRVKTEHKFLAVVAVEPGKDESSILVDVWNERPPEIPTDPAVGHITTVAPVSNGTVTPIGNK